MTISKKGVIDFSRHTLHVRSVCAADVTRSYVLCNGPSVVHPAKLGETEEDGALRREYVLVGDRQAVEINRAVDGQYVELGVRDSRSSSPLYRNHLAPATPARSQTIAAW